LGVAAWRQKVRKVLQLGCLRVIEILPRRPEGTKKDLKIMFEYFLLAWRPGGNNIAVECREFIIG